MEACVLQRDRERNAKVFLERIKGIYRVNEKDGGEIKIKILSVGERASKREKE